MWFSLRLKTIIAGCVLVALGYVGCADDFLTRTPPSSLSTATFYRTEADAVSAINAAYASLQLRPLYAENYPKLAEVPSDDIELFNTSGAQFDNFAISADLGQIEDVFTQCYEGIFRSNLVIQRVPEIEMDAGLQTRIVAEARFLRALYYWHLGTVFGDVPIVETADPGNPETAEVPKSSQQEVYQFAVQDLEAAIPNLPVRSGYDASDVGRATSGAAQALLGKIYLYLEDYPNAEQAFQQVLSSGEYDLLPNYADVFSEEAENSVESVFEVQYHDVGGNAWAAQDNAGANESTLRDRLSLPLGRGGFGNLNPTQEVVDEFEDGDARLAYSVWRPGDVYDPSVPGEETFRAAWTPTGFGLRKGMVPLRRNDASVGLNWPLIRYADVLLMYAEAANENGKLDAARNAVNEVRERAGPDPLPTDAYPAGDQQQMFDAIVHERRVELAFEYHRFHDLNRWGLAQEELSDLGYQPRHRFMPLPQAEIDVNDALEQNPDY